MRIFAYLRNKLNEYELKSCIFFALVDLWASGNREHAREKLKELEEIAKLEIELSKSETSLHSQFIAFVKVLEVRAQATETVKMEVQLSNLTPGSINGGLKGIPDFIAIFEDKLNQWSISAVENRRLDQIGSETQ